ncbi:hypothetical protein [Streptomyces sp. NPDC054863]
MDTVVFAGEVLAPVGVEVAVAVQCPKFQEGFDADESPVRAGDIEPVGDQTAAGTFDDAGRDGQPAASACS